MIDTTCSLAAINVFSVGYMSDSLSHIDCGSESLANLDPKWHRERKIVLCRFCLFSYVVVCQMAIFYRRDGNRMSKNTGDLVKEMPDRTNLLAVASLKVCNLQPSNPNATIAFFNS